MSLRVGSNVRHFGLWLFPESRRWKKINKDQLLNQGHFACFFCSPHSFILLFWENTPFEWLHLITIIVLFLNFKWKTHKLAFLVCSHIFFLFFLPCTFIFIVVFCKSSGHFGMRLGRKTQYTVKLPNTHLRVGKTLRTARKKTPRESGVVGATKAILSFLRFLCLLLLPFCLLFLCSRPSAVFLLSPPILFHRTVEY